MPQSGGIDPPAITFACGLTELGSSFPLLHRLAVAALSTPGTGPAGRSSASTSSPRRDVPQGRLCGDLQACVLRGVWISRRFQTRTGFGRRGFDGNDTGADLASFLFSRKLHLPDWPSAATMFIAADDFAAVYVNEVLAGTVGSVVDPSASGHTALAQLDIAAFLHPGRNKIRVLAQNGPASFAGVCSGPCTYAQNPAGVVFGGTISFA